MNHNIISNNSELLCTYYFFLRSVQFQRKTQINCTDSTNLRIILNVLYTFVEVLRVSEFETGVEFKEFRENLLSDIGKLIHVINYY